MLVCQTREYGREWKSNPRHLPLNNHDDPVYLLIEINSKKNLKDGDSNMDPCGTSKHVFLHEFYVVLDSIDYLNVIPFPNALDKLERMLLGLLFVSSFLKSFSQIGVTSYFKTSGNLHLPITMLQVYIYTFSGTLIQGRKQSQKPKRGEISD